jgi:TonB-dependent SusC/RagA subfamily outer membrane receptor
MTSSPSRVLSVGLVGLLVGIVAACHGRGASQSEAAPSPAPSPASSSTVTSDEIARQPAVSVEQLLAGRIAGVTVARASGGGISVQIRGPTSFLLSNEPLYVVDGVPIEPGPNGTLSWLNPHDIASIEVLKDAASTALYGVRGANGVIVIKTKGSH